MPGGKDSISGVSVCMLPTASLLTVLDCSYSEGENLVKFDNYAEELDDLGAISCGCAMYNILYRPRNAKVLCCAAAGALDICASVDTVDQNEMVAARFELARDCSHRESRNS